MTGMLLGATTGVGLGLVASWWRSRRASLEARIAPHLRLMGARGLEPRGRTAPRAETWLDALVRDGVRLLARLGAASRDLESRLRRAGSTATVDQYRAEQLVWGVAGAGAGLLFSAMLAATRDSSPAALLVLVAVACASGLMARDYALTRAVAKREARVLSELPTVAEMVALAVSAGEGVASALERVAGLTRGALAADLRATLGDAKAGEPLSDALRGLADRTGVAPLRRFAEGIAIAIDRGTPLADVLHAQATDVREAGRRRLMDEGGKREIAMMVPVVFLILPVTVVFAVFPGIVAINLGT